MTVTNEDILLALRDVATSLNSKIDTVATSLNSKIDTVATRLDSKIDAVAASLTAKIDAVAAVQVEHGNAIAQLQADTKTLQSDTKTLQSDMTEVKHTIGANHLKLSGKIEMVASMLADHMVDHHEPAGRKRA